MGKSYFHRVHEQTSTRFWINNATRDEAVKALSSGAVGCTQNPAYTWKMINNEDEKSYVSGLLDEILQNESDDNEALVSLQRKLVEKIAELFMPLYESSNGKLGYVSIQGDPFREDTESIVHYARVNRKNYPNIMSKVPVTVDGLKAIGILLKEGVPINATEVMALRQATDVCKVYESTCRNMSKPPVIYYSHIAGIFDEHMLALVKEHKIDIAHDFLWQAGIAAAKKIYQVTKSKWPDVGFISGGARGLQHFTEMVGASCAVTINWVGTADKLLEADFPVIQRFQAPVPFEVTDELCEKIEQFNKAYNAHMIAPEDYEEFGPVVRFRNSFETAWKSAVEHIKKRRASLK